ncbi:hypothetical protein L596_019434 [Steinernema carpocapsae]|uniref:G-protein coupled receptors family 1 profile domain-containing protein n=1 Tax=Steinernema carpocapsae TaxID=34508 RepID=A0A4U5MR13_STECR|nr:hypothetical protein L596_019434 [Steinernema carpocapsae]
MGASDFQIFGLVFFITATLFGLLQVRIIYIMIRTVTFRSRECYQLMIHIGVAQLLMTPGYVFIGLSRLFTFDPWLIPLKMMVSCVRVEIGLSFVLALNRLKIILDLEYPHMLHKILTVASWIVGVVHFTFLLSPCCEYHIQAYHYITRFDYNISGSYMLQRVGSLYMLGMSGATLVAYTVIVLYMIRKRFKLLFNKASHNVISKEKSILIYAVVRFICDSTLAVLYHFGAHFLPTDVWVEAILIYSYQFNNLFIPTFLYLVVCKSVRKELIPWRKVAKVHSVQVTTSVL